MTTPSLPSPPAEIELELPCQACGCHTVFAAHDQAHGSRSFLRCCGCGAERRDLAALARDELPA